MIGEYVIVARYLETRFYSQNVNFLSQINTNSVPGLSNTATIPGNSQSDYSDVDSGETEATDISDNEFTLGEFFKRKRYILKSNATLYWMKLSRTSIFGR